MKKFLLSVALFLTVIFALGFFSFTSINNYVSDQVASIVGININNVIQWQNAKGFNRDLALGDSGSDVKLLQVAMNRVVPGSSLYSGYYGSQTKLAVSDFQEKNGLTVTGKLDPYTRSQLNHLYFKELCPDGTGGIYPNEILIHVNKSQSLKDDFIPSELVDISSLVKTTGVACLKKDAVPYLASMFDDAKRDGINLAVTSAFRRKEVQSVIYQAWLAIRGEQVSNRVAEPLHSEHQLGTAIDVSGQSIGYISANDLFGGTKEFNWLTKNAYKYGFVMSYPKDKIKIDGYDYEPWHYRFVGPIISKEVFEKKESMEEYFQSVGQ